jgi:HD superfamily phosphohydrolase
MVREVHAEEEMPSDPENFGPYKNLGLLGEGSYARAFRVKLGSEAFALKWLLPSARPEGRPRFENEIWALQSLNHHAIPRFLDQGMHDGQPYLVMTLAKGRSLRRQLRLNARWAAVSGERWVLSVLRTVSDALAHMQLQKDGILHRDIKDDNVIATADAKAVSLIDFGFCKSSQQPRDVATPRNAGKIWFSPPSKLHNASYTHKTHDVFAVGVLGYLLLTNELPWLVPDDQDAGHLQELMKSTRPIRVDILNSLVSRKTASLVDLFLETVDDVRPTPAEALSKLDEALQEFSRGRTPQRLVHAPRFKASEVIRDPIHGDIWVTDFEQKILDAREFQRLRHIKQLGFSNLVFPGADHSRFSHSIGTLYCADKIISSLRDISGIDLEPEGRLATRLYALVHDATHIGFGHTLEDELGIFTRHDRNARRYERLVKSNTSQIGKLLASTEFGRTALARLDLVIDQGDEDVAKLPLFHFEEIISGVVGADVLDYVDRDSTFCGLDHRVDSAIFRSYKLARLRGADQNETHLASGISGSRGLRLDKEFAFETLLLERYALFLKIYTHPMKVAAGAMLGKAISEIAKDHHATAKLEEHLDWIGDSGIIHLLTRSRHSTARKIGRMLAEGHLYQAAYGARLLQDLSESAYEAKLRVLKEKKLFDPIGRALEEKSFAAAAKIDSSDVVIYCASKCPGFQRVRQYIAHGSEVTIRDDENKSYRRVRDRHLALWWAYVFVAPSVAPSARRIIEAKAKDLFGPANEIKTDRREGMLFM